MPLRLLHVSDIHFAPGQTVRANDPDGFYRDRLVDIVRQEADTAPFSAIIVTGDIAARGAAAEYQLALEWVDELVDVARCTREEVYVVPGNHDVDRSVIKDRPSVWHAQKAIIEARDDGEREGALKSSLAHRELGPLLFAPINAYNQFAELFECEVGPSSQGSWIHEIPFDHGYVLKLFGLNTVLTSSCKPQGGNDERAQNLYLGPFQTALRSAAHEIVGAACHHPPRWLLDDTRTESDLKDRAALHFFGHMHSRDVEIQAGYARFGAGAVNPDRHEAGWEPGFNVIDLAVEPDGGGFALHVNATVFAWQENPGLFRKHLTKDRQEVWRAVIKLPAIPQAKQTAGGPSAGATTTAAADPSPAEKEAPMGVDASLVSAFWELPSSVKRAIARKLELFASEDEARLPERFRYNHIFERARDLNRLAALEEAIRLAREAQ